MKCVEFQSTGTPADVLQCRTRETPVPRRGEVLVRMQASPVNPSDLMFVRGVYGVSPQLPQVPGFEGVGIVEAGGGGLKGRLFQGRRVAVLNKAGGNWAEHTVVPAAQVIPLSNQLSIEQAATFFVNPATAWIMTREVLRVPDGAWLLQTAAGSSLGKMVARLGRSEGFRTLNIVRHDKHIEPLKKAGATEVIVFDPARHAADELQHKVAAIIRDDGLRYAIDPVGGDTAAGVISCLSPDARMLVFGTLCDQPVQISTRALMTRHLTMEGFWLSSFMNNKGLIFKLRLVRRITRMILQGVLSTEIGRTFSLDDIQAAVRDAENSDTAGKTLLSIS
ncbi:MAG: zinc-dependent alcohol dehydrogenase family protein [Fuerstiella sp.]